MQQPIRMDTKRSMLLYYYYIIFGTWHVWGWHSTELRDASVIKSKSLCLPVTVAGGPRRARPVTVQMLVVLAGAALRHAGDRSRKLFVPRVEVVEGADGRARERDRPLGHLNEGERTNQPAMMLDRR